MRIAYCVNTRAVTRYVIHNTQYTSRTAGGSSLDTNALLVLRLGFLAALYLFLFLVARAAWRELRPAAGLDTAAKELTVLDPARSHWRKGERIPLAPGASIGRDASNAVVIDEDTVSARHAVFQREGNRWWLEDLGSTNGTFVNRRRLTGRGALRDGDEVRFGRVAMRFGAPGA